MSKIKGHYWDIITNATPDEDYEAIHYLKVVNDVVELIQHYSMQTVLCDVVKLLEQREVK